MKTYLKIVIGAIILGGVMAFFFYKDIKKEVLAITKTSDTIYCFQAGVFKSLENAQNFAQSLQAYGIYKDEEFYRVILAVTKENKEKLKAYYEEKEINFYIKEVTLDLSAIKKIENYDQVLEKTEQEDVLYRINQSMIELFLENVA